jgi:uncharacterized protein YdhG (YjbR/CyaY superfamily)
MREMNIQFTCTIFCDFRESSLVTHEDRSYTHFMKKPKDVDTYVEALPTGVQTLMRKIRATIKKGAPKAQECISYGMLAFKLNGKILVYFVAWEKHIGFYALPATNRRFAKDLLGYKHAKGSRLINPCLLHWYGKWSRLE